MSGIEERYNQSLDREQKDPELENLGRPAEKITLDFFHSMGLAGRFATYSEDEGRKDIGSKITIDEVIYEENKPIMAPQITTSEWPEVRKKKMDEMRTKPFVRLNEMKPGDSAIPKVLIYLDAKGVKTFTVDPDFSHHPEIALQILDSCILSLKFDLSQTKNPIEQQSVTKLIQMFDREKRKYIH